MINLITDLIQSLTICVFVVLAARKFHRLERLCQHPSQPPIIDYTEPEAVCGCKHHHCFHDENGCGHNSSVYEFNSLRPIAENHCGCKRYTGPEPLPQVIP